jgi:molecular chaperone DnaK (HSP70)
METRAECKDEKRVTGAGSRFLVGIDLGTSNCAMAFVEPDGTSGSPVIDFPIPQLQRPGQVGRQPLLPSNIYLPGEHEFAAEALVLPWDERPGVVVGEFARWQGARVPGRLVTSAKRWM